MRKLMVASLAVIASSSVANAELIYGVTTTDGAAGTALVSFDSATPATITSIAPITGVTNLRGIDFRPATGELYGLGYTGTTGTGQLYTISTTTGVATPVGGALALPNLGNTTRVSLDWNPTVDRLRVISGLGGNYRLTPTGTIAGTDTNLPTASTLISGIAYTNNFAGATSTTLYAYNYSTDVISTIGSPSPNDGTVVPVGSSGFVADTADMGFDISSSTGIAYLNMDDFTSLTAADEFYTVNLTTGAMSIVSTPLAGNELGVNLLDISVSLVVPEPTSLAAVALGGLLLKRRRA